MKMILDVDTGIDDALALAYALGSEEAEVVGVTCCFGNVTSEQAAENTLAVLHLLGADDIPVYVGRNITFSGEEYVPRQANKRVHGENGIGGVAVCGVERKPEEEEAAAYMERMAEQYGSELVIVATAAMTNLARFIRKNPAAAKRIGTISVMGGALTVPGNVTPYAEANIISDPEAAKFVFESGVPILMIGLDVTLQTLMSAGQIEEQTQPWRLHTKTGGKFADMLYYYCSNERKGCGMGAIHDPLAVAAVLHPELVTSIGVNLTVETAGESRGRTIGDLTRLQQKDKTVQACIGVDVPAFMEEFLKTAEKAMRRYR